MLILRFQAANHAYAVDCRRVVEVVPHVVLRAVPHAPPYLAGLLTYRGRVVPVLDLGRLLGGEACPDRLSTRIIVTEGGLLVGLLAERVSDLEQVAEPASQDAPVASAAYLGPVLELDGKLVQLLRVDRLPQPRELA
jgi:chemotaxis-related protein WspB